MQDFINTVTGVADRYLGEVERYREVYKENPSLLAYRLPPAAQAGIDLLKKVGIKLPSVKELNKKLETQDTVLSKAVGNIFRDTTKTVEKSGAEKTVKEGKEILKSLDWLL